ncbi:hypothetical protein A5884_000135 [Enterococcus sp. 7D2_DIV0200]|nr:hypothetical protein A5884_000135 [Enterococcus sp. 7D2_DIV0200]
MVEFNPPKILKADDEYYVGDILVLSMLNKRATYVNEPFKTFSGWSHSYEAEQNNINFLKVISKLKIKNLIRENLPKEILNHLTVAELKDILKNIYRPLSGKKSELIERVEKNSTDADICRVIDKKCFILTELGLEVLEKYKNVIWISENKEFIFSWDTSKLKFDEYYFMKHWDVNPSEIIIEHYESTESGIVARVYKIENNLEKAFHYGIRKLAEDINSQIERCKKSGNYNFKGCLAELQATRVVDIFKSLNISNDSLKSIIKYSYEFSIKDSTLISHNTFSEIVFSALHNEYENFSTLTTNVAIRISEKYGHELNAESTDFREGADNEEEDLNYILDMISRDAEHKEKLILSLIDEIDFELLKKMKIIIDSRLME